jgi:hypothetical protein
MKRPDIVESVAQKHGWLVERREEYKNGWSGQVVKNCRVVRAPENNVVKLVIDADGVPYHDAYYMGRDGTVLLCEYSEAFIRQTAERESAMVTSRSVAEDGSILLEVVCCA